MITSAWRLHAATIKTVECSLEQISSRIHTVTVTFGDSTFLYEIYPDASTAASRARQIRDGLLERGGWTPWSKSRMGSAQSDASEGPEEGKTGSVSNTCRTPFRD
jgi:hypothetical protein